MANNDWLEALHNAQPKHLEYLDVLLANKARLNVALCYGCGQVYTRTEIAKAIWPIRTNCRCTCGYEYTEKPYRPLTLWEIITRDKDSGLGDGVNPAALLRAMYEVLYG